MRRFILFDDQKIKEALLPLTFIRPVCDVRIGIFTIREKWVRHLNQQVTNYTEAYLAQKFPFEKGEDNVFINGALCPSEDVVKAILELGPNEGLRNDQGLLAFRSQNILPDQLDQLSLMAYSGETTLITKPWFIFQHNALQIQEDFKLLQNKSEKLKDKHTIVYGEDNLYVEPGVVTRAAVINAEKGPVYLGKDVLVQEGAVIAGSSAVLQATSISMGAKIRGDSTFGPYCKIGGEIGNSVVFGYTNKAHEGYLGNSVIGEWCNLGADTNTSNLKNNYANVKVWNYEANGIVDSGLTFFGLIMGDHSKCGINTMFNTGTVVGVSANVFGGGYPNMFIPSFSWGGEKGFSTYRIEKAFEVAALVMGRRNILFDGVEKAILSHIFETSSEYRIWDN